ncbi:MAG: hypothetical protein K0B07_04285 [DPANN group archaeon]|nr:hypothetical protein [DPANN group archaeon]
MRYPTDLDQRTNGLYEFFNPFQINTRFDISNQYTPMPDLDLDPPEFRHRHYPQNNTQNLKAYQLDISKEDRIKFLEYYSSSSKNISELSINPTQYLELFLITNIENPFDNKKEQLDDNKAQFFKWVYDNRHTIDKNKISDDIFTYIKNESHDIWNKKTDMITPEKIYTFITGINLLCEIINQLDTQIRTNGASHDFSFTYMNKSIKNYIKQDIETIFPPTKMFNLLKQKYLNKYAPPTLIEFVKVSNNLDSIAIHTDNILELIEHYSKEYNNRIIKGQLNDYKLDFQEIYNDLGGKIKKELFPNHITIAKRIKNKKGKSGNSKIK